MDRYLSKVAIIMEAENTSQWLREAIISSQQRDVVDALIDIEVLIDLTRLRLLGTRGLGL